MDFFELKEYSIDDIRNLIDNEIEENIHLDYKASGALSKEDKKRSEIIKDVSAFANSDGGVIIYGLTEDNHKPKEIEFIDGDIFTKEWLENIINLIQPRINSVRIIPIRENGDLKHSIYIIKIPRSDSAPHMARDNRYYKRFNFMSVPMEDYEVKDTLHRCHSPILNIVNGTLQDKEIKKGDTTVTFSFKAWIRNVGKIISKDYKLSASFFNLPKDATFSYQPHEGKLIPMHICDYCMRFTSPSKEALFPNELIETGHYQIEVPIKDAINLLDNVYIKMTLVYEDGGRDVMLVNLDKSNKVELYEEEEIAEFIRKEHPDFELTDIL